jgi:hypothetical protein
MKSISFCALLAALVVCFAGCSESPSKSSNAETKKSKASADETEAKIKSALAELSPEDRKAAEEQKFCAVQNKSRLGSMGEPVKLTIQGQPVFLCCEHCKEKALKDEKKTLATVKELKEKNKPAAGK